MLADANAMLSNGNFHVAGLAVAFDTLGLAFAHVGAALRPALPQKLFTPRSPGLPLQLTTHGPEHLGLRDDRRRRWSRCTA